MAKGPVACRFCSSGRFAGRCFCSGEWGLFRCPSFRYASGTDDREPFSQLAQRRVGTFRGYGPSFWDTPDGSRPQRADVDSGASEILTPVAIDVSEVAKGDGDAADEAVVWGGTVGCDRFSSEGDLTLEAGERSFFSLLPQTKEGKATGHVWVVTSWLIGPDDEVDTPLEGTRSMDQLIREIPAGKAKPAPPVGSGKPPESSP